MKALREHDRVDPMPSQPLDLAPFLGRWAKTNEKPGQWIERVEIERDGESNIRIRLWGGGAPSPAEWGEVPASALFATAIDSSRGGAFIAKYDFGFMESELQANVNLGLLVLAGYHRFRDGSGRSDLFSREFFRQEDGQ